MLWKQTRLLVLILFCKTIVQIPDTTAAAVKNGELPFQLLDGNLIVAQGRINSVDKLNIILDTGANCTLVSSDLVRVWSLQRKTESVMALSGTSPIEVVTLTEIKIGPILASNHRALVTELGNLHTQAGEPVAAIIGLDMLGATNFAVDFFSRRLVFDPSKSGKHVVHFLGIEPFPTVSVNIEGRDVRLLVDSGTPHILIFRNRVDLVHSKIEPEVTKNSAMIITSSGTVSATWFRAAHVSIGNWKLKEQIVLVSESPDLKGQIHGLLGLTQTGFKKVWFNFKDRTMAWE